jgi:hypothetical protein
MRPHEYKGRVKLVCLSECWQFNGDFSCSGRINFFAEWVAILTPEERQKLDDLVSILVGDQMIKGSLVGSCLWYGRYLQSKFYHHWHLLAPALVGLEDNSVTPASGDLVKVYSFVIEVAKLLKTRRNLALVEIVDELDNQNMLKPQMDEERAIPNQIVFATLGWLSMHRRSITACVKWLTNLSTRYALRSSSGPCSKQT